MATPLTFDMTLPDGEPLRFDTPGACWDGTVEEVMAAKQTQNTNQMNTQNLVTGEFTDAQKTAIETALQTILTNLPFGLDLTPEQRHDLVKVGDKSLAFLYRCRDLVLQKPSWLPSNFPSKEFLDDIALFDSLAPVETHHAQVGERITDTRMAAGSDAMVAALILYGIAKAAGQGANLDAALTLMGGRFAKKSKAQPDAAAKPNP
jgi:hypothetical protein